MKVLIATPLYPPSIGGPATYTTLLEKELPRHKIEVIVLSFDKVRHLPKGISHLVYFFKLWKRARSVDVIYAQDPVSVGLPAFYASKFAKKDFYLKIVGDYAWEQGVSRYSVTDSLDTFVKKIKGYPRKVRFLKKVEVFVARGAKKIIVPSQYLEKIVSAWGIPKEKIKVIHNSFEISEKREKIEERMKTQEEIQMEARKRLSIPEDVIVFLSVGRLVPWKGFDTLIELTRSMKKSHPTLRLYIVGSGPDEERLKTITKALKMEKSVIFTGSVSKEKVYEYIHSANIFILNTSYEGFSHQLLEVAALGTPIVTTNIGGNPELITNEKNGLLVEPDNKKALEEATLKILNNWIFRDKLIENGKEKVKEFGISRCINELIKILQ